MSSQIHPVSRQIRHQALWKGLNIFHSVRQLTAPYIIPGKPYEPLEDKQAKSEHVWKGCWPGSTDEDKTLARAMLKQEITMSLFMENCAAKAILSGGMGFALGAFFSLMSASFRYEDPFASPGLRELRTSQKAAEIFKDMGRGLWRGGRQWAVLGLLFSGVECCIESYRGKHDVWNVTSGGFITGALISRRNGVKSAILAGLGFGAFGAAIDQLWVEREPASSRLTS